jgi:hypothetical protein
MTKTNIEVLKTIDHSTVNGWGFGGVVGKLIYYSSGLVKFEGSRYYRHSKSSREEAWSISYKFKDGLEARIGLSRLPNVGESVYVDKTHSKEMHYVTRVAFSKAEIFSSHGILPENLELFYTQL